MPDSIIYNRIIEFIRSLYPDQDNIALHEPCFDEREKAYVSAAIESTFVSYVGEYVNRFEEMVCDITCSPFAVATVNGTAALHTALLVAGVQRDDEVITQPLSFVATANAISYCGARPVFLDVDKESLGLDPVALEQFLNTIAVSGKTSATMIKPAAASPRACPCIPSVIPAALMRLPVFANSIRSPLSRMQPNLWEAYIEINTRAHLDGWAFTALTAIKPSPAAAAVYW